MEHPAQGRSMSRMAESGQACSLFFVVAAGRLLSAFRLLVRDAILWLLTSCFRRLALLRCLPAALLLLMVSHARSPYRRHCRRTESALRWVNAMCKHRH